MPEISEEFKTVKKGGYDKEDVESKFGALKGAHKAETDALKAASDEKDKKIETLQARVDELGGEVDSLKTDIKEKYQSYIDNYESIGQIVYESKLRANEIISGAEEEKEKILAEARGNAAEEAEKELRAFDEKIETKKRKYAAISDETDKLIKLVNDMRSEIEKSFDKIDALSAEMDEEKVVAACVAADEEEEAAGEEEAAVSEEAEVEASEIPEESENEDSEADFDVADTHEYDASFRKFLNELAEEDEQRR